MTIDKIHYEELFPTGIYANIRMRAEATVTEKDDLTECYKSLQIHVQQAFQEIKPNYDEMKGTIIKPVEEEIPKSTKEQYLLDLISMSTTKVGLERFRNQITELNNEEVNRAFDKRMNEVD